MNWQEFEKSISENRYCIKLGLENKKIVFYISGIPPSEINIRSYYGNTIFEAVGELLNKLNTKEKELLKKVEDECNRNCIIMINYYTHSKSFHVTIINPFQGSNCSIEIRSYNDKSLIKAIEGSIDSKKEIQPANKKHVCWSIIKNPNSVKLMGFLFCTFFTSSFKTNCMFL